MRFDVCGLRAGGKLRIIHGFQLLVSPVGLRLPLGIKRRAADLSHVVLVNVARELRADVAGVIVRQKPRFAKRTGLVARRGLERHVQCLARCPRGDSGLARYRTSSYSCRAFS